VQRVRKAVDPPGEAKADWKVFCNLAEVMGSSLFSYDSEKDIFTEITEITPQYAGMTWERLNRVEGLQWPCPSPDHPGTKVLHGEKFATSDGIGVFKPIELRSLSETPDEEYPFILSTGG
jgi:formate dehydrogenase major subunit